MPVILTPFIFQIHMYCLSQKSISNRGLLSGATWGLLWVTWKILLWIHSRKPGVYLESKDNPGLVWVNFLLG